MKRTQRASLFIRACSILNLFSKDVNAVDEVLPRVFSGFFRSEFPLSSRPVLPMAETPSGIAGAAVLAILVVMGITIPVSLVAFIPLAFFYYRVMQYVRTRKSS